MKTRKFLSIIALILAVALALSAVACGNSSSRKKKDDDDDDETTASVSAKPFGNSGDATAAPAVTATPAPTGEPSPTDEPSPTGINGFDKSTMTFSDQYVSFIVPDEVTKCTDYTSAMASVYNYDLYLMFTPSAAVTNPNVGYYYKLGVSENDSTEYVNMDREQLESIVSSTYSAMLGEEIDLHTTKYEQFTGSNYKGLIFEYDLTASGVEMNQYLWSVITDDGVLLCIAYTWSSAAPMDIQTSVASITVK